MNRKRNMKWSHLSHVPDCKRYRQASAKTLEQNLDSQLDITFVELAGDAAKVS
jgi:hypothetical protein